MTRLQLRQMRELYGFSLRELATEAEISHSYLQQLENGAKPIYTEQEKSILTAMYSLTTKKLNNSKN